MCLILFAYQHHSHYPLVLAANRDERFDRPTRAAQFWPEDPNLLAGKDLEAGGTWMGITRGGRFAAVTNFRGHPTVTGVLSRGRLCSDFLQSNSSSGAYAEQVIRQADQYAGFNLLVNDGNDFFYCNNHNNTITPLQPGIYGLSNGLLDVQWPKINKGKQGLANILNHEHVTADNLLTLLRDEQTADDLALPNTGVGLQRERQLSPLFIRVQVIHTQAPGYGTCNSTALLIDRDNHVLFKERSFYQPPIQSTPNDQQFSFSLQTSP